MAQRRPAPEEAQPKSFAFSAANQKWVAGQVAKYPEGRQASAVIPLLWQAQKQAGAGCRASRSSMWPACWICRRSG